MTNERLIQQIKTETEAFRADYIKQVMVWADGEFDRIEKAANVPYPRYEDFATPGWAERVAEGKVKGLTIDYAQGKKYHKACDARHAACMIVEKGRTSYISKMAANAERHYQDSVIKLAIRIESKGLDISKLEVKSARVSVNLEIVFTDGVKTVKAWTIVASGEVQKPHYRYLVK